ncbi:hypothetical protein Y032_0001g11 [Ancylostoma ceylanicum]|nr:hypothetical protein Y032_0001g11 [Ancylostoma ceylanicum]
MVQEPGLSGAADVRGGSRVRALAHRFETGDTSGAAAAPRAKSDDEVVKERGSEQEMLLVVHVDVAGAAAAAAARKTTDQPARARLSRSRASQKKRPQSSSDPLQTSHRQPYAMRKCGSAHSNLCTVQPVEIKPRVRREKPPPPQKPVDLAQRAMTWSKCSQPGPSSKRSPLPERESSTPREQTNGNATEVAEVPTVSSTPSTSRNSRPRLAPPPPPPPKKPARLISRDQTSENKPRLYREISSSSLNVETISDSIYQQLPSPEEALPRSPRLPSSAVPDERPRPSVPTIPLPLPPQSHEDPDDDDYECYEQIDYSSDTLTIDGSVVDCSAESSVTYKASGSEPTTARDRRSETFAESQSWNTSSYPRHSLSLPGNSSMCPILDRPQTAATVRKKPPSPRSAGASELEKLFRLKSSLQQNISKKVDQLRQKVGERRIRTSQSVESRDIDYSTRGDVTAVSESGSNYKNTDDDIYVYGDEWSSEDDDDQNVYEDRRSSMYKELEQQLNRAFPVAKMESEYEYDSADFVASDEGQPRPEALPFAALSVTTGSSTDEPSPEEEDYARQYTSRLPTDQPLYQIYMLAEHDKLFDSVLLRSSDSACGQEEHAMESTGTVDLFRRESCASSDSGRGADCSTSASALTSNTSMRRERLIATSHFGSQRSLWCELEEVRAAGLLNTLDDETKMRQEAYFEVITSEASYLRSLNILITHFMASQELMGSKSSFSVISNSDRKQLFSNIFAVRDCSERLLSDLETRLEHSLVLDDLCGILLHHFETNFDVYIKYCSNQVYQERTLRRLKAENPAFLTAISRMEADKQCQGLDMRSFLMLPMQRVTRYPLLVYAILDRLKRGCDEYEVATKALHAANRVVGECNEGARRMERTEQLLEVDSRLVYKDPDLKKIALVSNCRYLVKRGSLVQLMERKNRNILQGKQKTRNVYIFLFSDIILVTKKKLNGTYECKDYAARRYIDVQPLEVDPNRTTNGAISSLTTRPHLFLCVFMRNARGRQTELLLNAESETDRERWLSALRPPISANPEEKIYAEWDCPQAVAVHTYNKNQDDELSLEVGDMVNILRKMPDGWFFGEKTSDGQSGWFPSSYVQQILNDHVRANNYRKRLRLIQAAGSVSTRESPPRSSATPLMDRLRRMSNPRFLFQADPTSAL